MAGKLAGKVALITGSSAGIGWASALALAEEGASLVLTARRQERLSELEEKVQAVSGKAISVIGDAREEETAIQAVQAAVKNFGRLDILINNTGVGNYKNLVETTAEDYDEMMAGIYGFAGEAVYCATKFAQVGFAQALDKELRTQGIKVGVRCPGGVKTEFALGKGRTEDGVVASTMLEPEDVAGAVLLACTQAPGSRIIEIQMRPMSEGL